ncbi:Dihydrolipoyllysine-residue acetyltransferase component of pyruvate dehydrogenase complex [Cardinium endosymbiont cEper1 of Encarsia pergandiella]|uniref:dihydrolipoamide acetyltransferase family protein n=1 Tax=Cardinium endosymbiont of Encarsia pergandiella TaxID=249402 RepID=UPI00027EA8E1|nr:dihydrolipoamide acetyltransferase family protein [Cardinium endosymbiont of Encarsia pergandiella]CCM09829.1 Dihydrolipoyllysine-residue acetyltransferase component of pyruvate dehydrogenase complex [Cardinium endosymbiont cEper1 of Encarsia pergandiella]
MAECIRMPKMSDTMEYGIVSRWIKQVGDKVVAGDILAEVDTDKATMELESYEDGTLLYVGVAERAAARINDIIAIIGDPEEDINTLLASTVAIDGDRPADTRIDLPLPIVDDQPVVPTAHMQSHLPLERSIASPLAKKIAKEKGYDLSQIQGSGEAGRIIKKDVIHFVPNRLDQFSISEQSTRTAYQDFPISAMRQKIAEVLTESKMNIPHFYLTVDINMNKLVEIRAELNQYASTKISINDLIIKATALALIQHPKVNAAWLTDKIRSYQYVHIGVAVAVEDGLMVPVVRFADQKPLVQISKTVKILSKQAQQKTLTPKDYTGATFTISNLGMFGITSFSAIINPPAACILAIGAMQQIPIFKDNQVVPAHMLQLTLSCDHRVVDGHAGALFLATLKTLLEQPLSLLL